MARSNGSIKVRRTTSMKLENLITVFIDTFPEFKEESLKFIGKSQGDPGEYVFF